MISNSWKKCILIIGVACAASNSYSVRAAEPIRVLIIDGRNNHDWLNTSAALMATLKSTGVFNVDTSTAPTGFPKPMPRRPKETDATALATYTAAMNVWKNEEKDYNKVHESDWGKWRPEFKNYSVVVNDYNGPEWPKEVKDAFVDFVRNGGGVVNIHAANNAFTAWPEFNQMIGIGWRAESFGQRIAVKDTTGEAIAVPASEESAVATGFGSGHGSRHEFVVKSRDLTHPILKGLPTEWLHGRDELYHRMRGSLDNLHILASAFSDTKERGTGLHEPVMWWVPFGKGRVVTLTLGHLWIGDTQNDALYCVGFQTLLARSTEWAATGNTSIPAPDAFPTHEATSILVPSAVKWQH